MDKVTVMAPAKLNLALDITGMLPNGYHTVDMVMQAVDIYERVEVAKSAGYTLCCPGSRVPVDDSNTATKAAKAFFTHTGLLAGADITIHKTVPTRAGMAGGSADAAAVLVGLNMLYKAGLPKEELCDIGATIGADVPFSLLGGTARVGGIGEILSPLPPMPECWFVVAMPKGLGVSTPQAYAQYDGLECPQHPDVGAVTAAIKAGDLAAMCAAMGNGLQAASGDAATEQLCGILKEQGALAAMMTGSGAAVFGIFTEQASAAGAAEAVQPLCQQTFVARPVAHGPRRETT